SYSELNQSPSKVGAKAYVNRWGGWRKALRAFVNYVSSEDHENNVIEPEQKTLKVKQKKTKQGKSRSINLSVRYKVLVRDNFKCVLCGLTPALHPGVVLHIDHIIPW